MKSPTGPEPLAITREERRRRLSVTGLTPPNGDASARASAPNAGLWAPLADTTPKSSALESCSL